MERQAQWVYDPPTYPNQYHLGAESVDRKRKNETYSVTWHPAACHAEDSGMLTSTLVELR